MHKLDLRIKKEEPEDCYNFSQIDEFMNQIGPTFAWKSKLLNDNIQTLKCSRCDEVPSPGSSCRYICTENVHSLCEDCKVKCHCGSEVCKMPSPHCESLLKVLPWFCKNYKTGCREILTEVSDLEMHQKYCKFRLIPCIYQGYGDCSQEVPLVNWQEHLIKDHQVDAECLVARDCDSEDKGKLKFKRWFLDFPTKVDKEDYEDEEDFWFPSIFKGCNSENFVCMSHIKNGFLRIWVICMDAPVEAKEFVYTVSCRGKSGEEFYFKSVMWGPDDFVHRVIDNGRYFSMPIASARNALDEENGLAYSLSIWKVTEDKPCTNLDDSDEASENNDRSEPPAPKRIKI